MRTGWLVMWLVASALPADGIGRPAAAQSAASADADLAECTAAAAVRQRDRMESAAARLEAAAAAMERERAADALVVRARVRSQCRIPFASMMRRGALLDGANELLERALELEPRHLVARFTLGMNHFHAPAFLGRAPAATRELERVLQDHGELVEPVVALTYLHLGSLYARLGREEQAVRTWRRGAELFPAYAPLAEKAWSESPNVGAGAAPPDDPPAAPETVVYALAPIIVEGSSYSVDDPRTPTRLSKQEVYTLPGGAADIFQALQTLPGVTRVGDGGDLYVRGGDPAETPIYVDGARLFHPGRFETLNGSIFGVLDPSVMRTAYFSSGGFSARYGNALSGVVALETERRPLQRRWRAGANLASAGGTVWQPLGARAGLWSTGMLTHTRLLLGVHGRTDDYPESPTSRQLMVGFAVEPRGGLELRATALSEADQSTAFVSAAGHDGRFRSEAATRLATAELRAATPDGRTLARLTLGASMRESRFRFGVLERDREDHSLNARLDGQLTRTRVTLRAGLEAARLATLTDGTVPAGEEMAPGSPAVSLDREEEDADHLGGYAEVEWRVARRLALIAGLRADELPGAAERRFDPRLAAAYQLQHWTFRVAGGLFSQGPWRTRYAIPSDASPAGVPLRARHLVAGVQHHGAPALRAELYVKRYTDYVGEVGVVGDAPPVVAGRTAGLDVLLRPQAIGRLAGWLTYSYLHGGLELERGDRVPSRYDVTHTLTAVGKLSADAWEAGLTARYATGRPFTPILGAAPPTAERPVAPIYGPLHSARLPDYFRLDGRLTRLVPLRGGVLAAYVEGLNLLDRGNVVTYTYDATYRNPRPVATFFGDRTLLLGLEAQF